MLRQVVIKASEGHRAFGKLLKRVYRSDEHLIVERDGLPVAVLMSYKEYERLSSQRAVAAFDTFSRHLGRELEQERVTEEDLLADVKDAKREVYEERYGGGPRA